MVIKKRTLSYCVQIQIPTLGGIGGVYTSPCYPATPMPSVRTVGSFSGLGVPPEASLRKGPAQEAM